MPKIKMSLIDEPPVPDRIEILPEAINELAESIAQVGLLSPILITPRGDRYELVYGHRRYLAHKKLGLDEIEAHIRELTPEEVSLLRATENVQREDLTPIEEARTYNRMINDLGMSIEAVASKVGISPGVVRRRMSLLRMPDSFQVALHRKQVSIAVAEELWSCPDESYRDYLLEMAIEHGVTKNVARQWVQDFRKAARTNPDASEQGGPLPVTGFTEKIYRGCDACRGPVELSQLRELRLCPECYKFIVDAINNGG